MNGALLLEIGTEELPAGFIVPALEGMKDLLRSDFDSNRIGVGTIMTMGTPRRLTLCAKGVAAKQEDTIIDISGPPEKVAFDTGGNPTKAAQGFAARNSVSVSDLTIVATPKGNYVHIVREVEGKDTLSLLPDILQKIILKVPFPKSMRWGDFGVRFARPIKWLLCIFDGTVVPLQIEDMRSSNQSWGHRFLRNCAFIVQDVESYRQCAEAHFVIPDIEKRKQLIREDAERLAAEGGGEVLSDPDLLDTVANLVEYPVTLRGSFAPEFLTLPRDVLICSMKEHQKYFAVVDSQGSLLPYFIVVSNNQPHQPAVVIQGNERVLSARLTDARFFFEADRKRRLSERVPELQKVVYQASLGSMYDKVCRLKELGRHLVQSVDGKLVDSILRAAHLCKADLITEMVGEFPSLQGIIGREYALLDGETAEISQALYEHYLPTSGKGALPDSVIGALLSIADKIDNITGCFGIGLTPTGTADPHALRRQALGIINIIEEKSFALDLPLLIGKSIELFDRTLSRSPLDIATEVLEFIRIRFHHRLTAQGYDADVVEACTSACFVNLVDVLDRIKALQSQKTRPEFRPLAVTFKRVENITSPHSVDHLDPQRFSEEAEKNLYASFLRVEQQVRAFVKARQYPEVFEHLATLKPAVDAFFDGVLVMCEDTATRENRIGLLSKVASLFQGIADFSRIATET